jgi:predicted transcriptional regulator
MTGIPQWIPTDSVCQEACEMASRGLTVSQISDCLGISESTLYGKQNEYKEFLDAIKKGRAEGLNKVSNALFKKATQGNVTAMIYYLKVRDRENWGENQPEPMREIPPMQIIVDSRAVRNYNT